MADIAAYATVSSKGQLTLPKPMRSALGLEAGVKLGFRMVGEEIHITKVSEGDTHEDPVLAALLETVARDISAGKVVSELPEEVVAFARSRDLSNVDLDEEITGDVAL